MKQKFYPSLFSTCAIAFLMLFSVQSYSQSQGFYIDTVKWTNASSVTVNIRTKSMTNFLAYQGSIKWDTASLVYASSAKGTIDPSNLTLSSSDAITKGEFSYLYFDGSLAAHNVADGVSLFTLTFNVKNNPIATHNNNNIVFSNTPTGLEIDTVDAGGTPAQLFFPALENHTSGYVSFARPPVLSYAAGNITDSVTNRPATCSYQWLESGNPVAGPNSSTYPNSPAGNFCLEVTYPNGNKVNCLAGSGNVLPVKLSNFVGKNTENKNQLNWTTSTELNTNNFVIERSNNGKNFTTIGSVKAIGNSSTAQSYTFEDANILNNNIHYYRLKINDNNGQYSYSNVIIISKENKNNISLYPNPAKGFVTISGDKIENIVVTNILGKTVLQQEFNKVSTATLNTTILAKGIYNITVKNATSTTNVKLIVE